MDYPALEQFASSPYGFATGAEADVWSEATAFLEDASSAWNDRNKQVAAGSLRGALTGFASGGYPGAILGAVGGGVAARDRATATPPKAQAPSPAAAAAAPNVPALQMIAAMLRPEIFEAFASMAMGRRGNDKVSVGGTEVPVAAVATMIQQLAAQASSQHKQANRPQESEDFWPEYSPFVESEDIVELLTEAAWQDQEFDAGEDEYEAEGGAYLPEWAHHWPWVPR